MPKAFLVLLTFGFSVLSFSNQMLQGRLDRVIDGDTIVFTPNKMPNSDRLNSWGKPKSDLHIRMLGMDAPETHLMLEDGASVGQGHWGEDATRALTQLLQSSQKVAVESFGFDKYHRTLGRVIADGEDVHLKMLKAGRVTTYFLCADDDGCGSDFLNQHHVKEYVEACEEAQENKRGIWNPSDLLGEMPFEFRMRSQGRKPERFVGDFHTKKLFQPEDYHKVPPCARVFFQFENAAKAIGFTY